MQLRDRVKLLTHDSWRDSHPFASDVQETQATLFADGVVHQDQLNALLRWLAKGQPCLFGRIAAKTDLLSICILTDQDLESGDTHIRDRIRASRLTWRAEAFRGRKSGFVVALISKTIAESEPNSELLSFSQQFAELYLRREIAPDQIFLDRVYLEVEKQEKMTWEWDCGVNFFGAAGDGRWWRDHRMPGGIAFSVNSVGHMAKAGALTNAAILEPESRVRAVSTLGKALELAMRTISLASDTQSGPATELLPVTTHDGEIECPDPPADLPADLRSKDHCVYTGWYHTDYTLPSEYFQPNDKRPTDVRRHKLDFTYLQNDETTNPAFETMGEGIRVRTEEQHDEEPRRAKRLRMEPRLLQIAEADDLSQALGRS